MKKKWTSNKLKFGKKTYTFDRVKKTKTDAKKELTEIRKKTPARMIKRPYGYDIYTKKVNYWK